MGIRVVKGGFGKFGTTIALEAGLTLLALLPQPALLSWAAVRSHCTASVRRAWDTACLGCYVLCQATFLTLGYGALLVFDLPIVSSLIISIETIRFMMKMHAFVRSVSPRTLEGSPAALPSFSSYLYFLFAPTLIYRDVYPRTAHRSWRVVAARLLEVAAIIFYISFLFERFFLENFSNFGKPHEVLEAKQLVKAVFSSMLPALLVYLCGFYLLLHSWLNAAAELLRFADRMFYMDWWNQSSYATFYRMWNMVVHDWLRAYVYKDVLAVSGSRLLATLVVFAVSAVVHELILSFSFRFFYPVMLLHFGFFGVLFVFMTKKSASCLGNIFIWWSLAVGNGTMFSLYLMEWFARHNTGTAGSAFFVPRSWSCQTITFNSNWTFHNPLTS